MAVFENRQDTTLLHNSLLSAVNYLNSCDSANPKRAFHLVNECGAVNTVVAFLQSRFTYFSHKVTDVEKFLLHQVDQNRRMHSALFFVALRSNGISCPQANIYYQSIAHIFPTFDWKFYIILNFWCNWSEYFIECAIQLEPDILAIVVKQLLHVEWEQLELENGKLYSWHLALQIIILKFFMMDDPTLCTYQKDFPFDFPFCISASDSDLQQSDKKWEGYARSQLLHAYITLLNQLLHYAKPSIGSCIFVKIILHAYKTIFRLLIKLTTCDGNCVKELFRLNPLLTQVCSEDSSQKLIKPYIHLNEDLRPDHCYLNTSWKINLNYLIFLICTYWNDVLMQISSSEAKLSFPSIPLLLPSNEVKTVLKNLSPVYKEHFGVYDRYFLHLLKTIVQYQYPCASRAAEMILVHSEAWTSNEIISTIEKNVSLLHSDTYKLLADAVLKAEPAATKLRFLNLFYEVLSRSSVSSYNDALKYILNQCGYNDHYRLPNFDVQINLFTRKTFSFEEAKKILPPLILQSPEIALKTVIEQALLQGSEGMALIQVFRYIPAVCNYKYYSPLVTELTHFFLTSDLEIHEKKNLPLLLKSLMEVQVEEEIMPFDMFVKKCITPNITLKETDRLVFISECLNITLEVLVSRNALKISSGCLVCLIENEGILIDLCLKMGHGRLKELAIVTLSLLSQHEEQNSLLDECALSLQQTFTTLDPVVFVYTSTILGKEIYEATLKASKHAPELMLPFCCFHKDINLFVDFLSLKEVAYEEFLSILIPSLNHFTKEEWLHSALLIEEYCNHFQPSHLSPNMPWQFTKDDSKLYGVIRCLVDCFSFLLENGKSDVYYSASCFIDTVMSVLNKPDVQQCLFVVVFLDMCHLASNTKVDILTMFSSFLLVIRNKIFSLCKVKSEQDNYLQLLFLSIKSLPESNGKDSLLQKFS